MFFPLSGERDKASENAYAAPQQGPAPKLKLHWLVICGLAWTTVFSCAVLLGSQEVDLSDKGFWGPVANMWLTGLIMTCGVTGLALCFANWLDGRGDHQ
jgi:hypothetical protein